MRPGDRVRWLQPTVGVVTDVREGNYFEVEFEGQSGSFTFDVDEAIDFKVLRRPARHAKPKRRWKLVLS